ncbi:hypothetical protein BDV06DRAFT_48549 [Aspergillus oleicola]
MEVQGRWRHPDTKEQTASGLDYGTKTNPSYPTNSVSNNCSLTPARATPNISHGIKSLWAADTETGPFSAVIFCPGVLASLVLGLDDGHAVLCCSSFRQARGLQFVTTVAGVLAIEWKILLLVVSF